jgi:hypothetical protein
MKPDELAEMLKNSVQVDIDTVCSYNRVMDDVPDPIIRSKEV